jgi:hypothetical protein
MFNNWYVEERLIQSRHQEMLKASEEQRLANMAMGEKGMPLHAKTLSSVGKNMVKAGFWLQDRYGAMVDFSTLELDDPYCK